MKFRILTLFPDLLKAWSESGLIGSAAQKGLIDLSFQTPRTFTNDVHQTVDDKAFGGSDGMLQKFEPWAAAFEEALSQESNSRLVVMSPQGQVWSQALARSWSEEARPLVFACGRYAGFDHRLITAFKAEEISIGDYVLNGGEMAAAVVIESVARLIPGVLGNKESSVRDSFSDGWLESPAFTRPREVRGLPVPSPLLSGHHEEIRRFEVALSVIRTRLQRPDLFAKLEQPKQLMMAVRRVLQLTDAELQSLGFERAVLNRWLEEI